MPVDPELKSARIRAALRWLILWVLLVSAVYVLGYFEIINPRKFRRVMIAAVTLPLVMLILDVFLLRIGPVPARESDLER